MKKLLVVPLFILTFQSALVYASNLPGLPTTGELNSTKSCPGQGDPGQGDPGHGDPGQGDPGQGDPGQGDPGQGDPGQGDPGQGDPGQGDPGQGDPGQGDPGQGDPGQGDPGQDDPGQGDPGQDDPGQCEPPSKKKKKSKFSKLECYSSNFLVSECKTDKEIMRIFLEEDRSGGRCTDSNWAITADGKGVWVDNGCSAVFKILFY